jgi:hypothetical protein
LKESEMNRLVVDDDAVEVKYERSKHGLRLQKYPFVSN